MKIPKPLANIKSHCQAALEMKFKYSLKTRIKG